MKDLVLTQMKPLLLGEDPLNIDTLYTKVLMRSAEAGAIGGVTVAAASGIEIALFDLAGRLLDAPVANRPFYSSSCSSHAMHIQWRSGVRLGHKQFAQDSSAPDLAVVLVEHGEAIRVITAYDLDAGQKKDYFARRLRGE